MVEENKAEGKQGSKVEEFTSKLRKNPYIVSTIVLGLFALILVVFVLKPGITGSVISGGDAGKLLLDFAQKQGVNFTVISVTDSGSFYEVEATLNGQQSSFPVTKDGKFLLSGVIPLTGNAVEQPEDTETPKEIPKSDKPKVELFIMTHCPYGTQAEKGIIPVLKLLDKKIDGKIRFVHYFMHGDKEENETYTQLCIREEQSTKFLTYLECFLEDGNSERCLTKTAIDKTKLNSCLQNKAKDYYASDSALSQGYGVQGSPSLVVNGIEASSGRSSSAFLTTICSAFNTEAGECSQTLSTQNPSAGFGYATGAATATASNTGSGGSCG